jgi:glutamyl-tRNA synthetase
VARGFREDGYLPEALVNFLAFLGWNPGTEQEMFTMDDLIQAFSLEQINKAGARFDIQKAKWFNHEYLRQQPNEQLAEAIVDQAIADGFDCTPEKAAKIAGLLKERVNFAREIYAESTIFFRGPESYDSAIVAAKWNDDAVRALTAFKDALISIEEPLTVELAKTTLAHATTAVGIKQGKIMQALRLAITGVGAGPDLMITLEIIGKQETINRLQHALEKLSVKSEE